MATTVNKAVANLTESSQCAQYLDVGLANIAAELDATPLPVAVEYVGQDAEGFAVFTGVAI